MNTVLCVECILQNQNTIAWVLLIFKEDKIITITKVYVEYQTYLLWWHYFSCGRFYFLESIKI